MNRKSDFKTISSLAQPAVVLPALTSIIICEYCCGCQLLLSMIMHAMKRQSCIINEDVHAELICGGKDRNHWATMEMSVMFKLLPSPCLSFWLIV